MKNKNFFLLAPIAAMALMARTGHAVTIAIVDSGVDIQHEALSGKIWDNPGEVDDGVDNDDNGFVDDLHGWNFVDGNNHLVNRHLIGTFPPDVYKFFEVQTRSLKGVATDEDKAWMTAHRGDAAFIAKLEEFGNFVHGTHVAGISSKDAAQARIMGLKIIGTPTPIGAGSYHGLNVALFNDSVKNGFSTAAVTDDAGKEKIIKMGLDLLAKAQGQGLAPSGAYVHDQKARVANCSFGTGREQIKPLIKQLIEAVLKRPLTDDELNSYANYFMKKVADAVETSFIAIAPETLFVIAAGNDGTNNDEIPASPANIKIENTMTVAATMERSKLASFSNFGETMVDIAAPGVGIKSSIPGNEYVQLSGTSQATPYITNLAGRLFDTNPKLSISDVKRILMETVDKKDFLLHKVKSAGVANGDRAIYAARMSLTLSLSDSIRKSNRDVKPVASLEMESVMDDSSVYVSPLPMPLF